MRQITSRRTTILIVAAAFLPNTCRGASWHQINNGIPGINVGVTALGIDPKSPSTIYAQTIGMSAGVMPVNGLFKSTDGAASWGSLSGVEGVTALAVDPVNPSTLYVGTSHGVFRSANGGETWMDVSSNLPDGSIPRLLIDPVTPSTLYALYNSSGSTSYVPGGPILTSIFKTTDSGKSWTALNTGLDSNAYITVLAIDPTAGPKILTAGDRGANT